MQKQIKSKVDVFFKQATALLESGQWTHEMQDVMDDLKTVPSCSDSPESVQLCIDRVRHLAGSLDQKQQSN